jgi:hypothetical protein
MSLSLRPVIETWGESLTFSSRDQEIWAVLTCLVSYAEQNRSIAAESLTCEHHEYGDMNVLWISDGNAFLDFLTCTSPQAILDSLANDGMTSADEDEYARQREDVTGLCQVSSLWRTSIDPHCGSLRIYCD